MPHYRLLRSRTSALRTLALCLAATVAYIPLSAQAVEGYNVNEGEEWASTPPPSAARRQRLMNFSYAPAQPQPVVSASTTDSSLPTLAPITLTPPSGMRQHATTSTPTVALTDTHVPSPDSAYLPPVSGMMMPKQPLYPQRGNAAPTESPALQAYEPPPAPSAIASAPVADTAPGTYTLPNRPEFAPPAVPQIPIVATATAPAAQEVAQLPPPPAPTGTLSSPASAPVAPTIVPPAPAVAQDGSVLANAAQISAPPLSSESKQILDKIRPATPQPTPPLKKVTVKRVSPEVADIVKRAEEVYESAGVSIRVSSSTVDTTSELERAYNALMGGETEVAVRIYQEILEREPTNEDALFGLAATYHRTGQVDNARPLYGRLLAQNPNHREGLNNFLILVAGESPREALEELARLENRNPRYSPIPAQMAILYDRLGEPEIARSKMLRAIEISPENWMYKYNLAIMLDRQGAYADAAALYRDIINASLQGNKLPVNVPALQARLNYIGSRT